MHHNATTVSAGLTQGIYRVLMRSVLRLLLAWACLVTGQGLAHGAAKAAPDFGPVPAWVERIGVDLSAPVPVDQIRDGIHFLLSDQQMRVNGTTREQYRHSARKAVNLQGVESIANVAISFDPSYQTLVLHAITLHRGTQQFSRLVRSAVRVLQREKELDYLIYDGSMTANLFLEDVRVGDTVEIAYTLRGHNPVFGQRHFGQFDLQWQVPVHQVRARLMWPTKDPMAFNYRNGASQGQPSESSGFREMRWRADQTVPIQVEKDLPAWYDPYPHVQWASFKDWAEVAQWAEPLYRPPGTVAPPVQHEIDRIAKAHLATDERLVESLRFVQRNIRYLGIEVGAGSHAPTDPATVLARRFGDCKDKTLLLLTLLQGLGIEARAALVSTQSRQGVADQLASPGPFNHVLVRARIAGTDYWVDPTLAPQEGKLSAISQPRLGLALVIDAATTGLQAIALADASVKKKRVRSVYDVTAGLDKPVQFTVTTVSEGASAESLRAVIGRSNTEQLQRDYQNFYAKDYPGITIVAPIRIDDDLRNNRLTVTERYAIDRFWIRNAETGRQTANVESHEIWDYLKLPREAIRTQPLALDHPQDFEMVTVVQLPENWPLKPESQQITDPAFHFSHQLRVEPRVLTLTDQFRSLKDHVPPGDIERHLANLRQARDMIGLSLYKDATAATPAATPLSARLQGLKKWPALLTLLGLAMALGWSLRTTRRIRQRGLHATASDDAAKAEPGTTATLTSDPTQAAPLAGAATPEHGAPFHLVSTRNYLLLFYSTLGAYEIYWHYRNWRLIRQREQTRIYPAMRALFGVFFCYALFTRVRDFPQSQGRAYRLPAAALAIGWILASCATYLGEKAWLGYYLIPLFSLPVLAAMQVVNRAVAPLTNPKAQLRPWQWIGIFLGLLLLLFILLAVLLLP